MSYPFLLEKVRTLQDASRRIADSPGKAAVIGGGLEILDEVDSPTAGSTRPDILIPIGQIPDTSYIHSRGDQLRLGAALTIAEIAESDAVRRLAWPLSEAAAAVGSPQIRAQGTLAGNLLQRPRCWYLRGGFSCHRSDGSDCPAVTGDHRYHAIFDGGPCWSVYHSDLGLALHALNAQLIILNPDGKEREMPVRDLYPDPKKDPLKFHTLQPGEIIREIRLAGLSNRYTGTFLKITERGAFDFALASVAVVYNNFHGRFKNIQLFLGGVAPRAYTPEAVVKTLSHQKLDRSLLAAAASHAADVAAPLPENGYKMSIVKNLVRRALEVTYDKLSWKPD